MKIQLILTSMSDYSLCRSQIMFPLIFFQLFSFFIGQFVHIIIGFITSFSCFLFSFIKGKKLSSFISELQTIDDELFDLCERVHIDYKMSFKFQLKLLAASAFIFCFVGGFDYYVFQGWVEEKLGNSRKIFCWKMQVKGKVNSWIYYYRKRGLLENNGNKYCWSPFSGNFLVSGIFVTHNLE